MPSQRGGTDERPGRPARVLRLRLLLRRMVRRMRPRRMRETVAMTDLPTEYRAQWTDGTGAQRAGTVWSPGPVGNTWWIVPDERREGEGLAVCLLRVRAGEYKQREVDLVRSGEDWQRGRLAKLTNPPRSIGDRTRRHPDHQLDYIRAHRGPVKLRGARV